MACGRARPPGAPQSLRHRRQRRARRSRPTFVCIVTAEGIFVGSGRGRQCDPKCGAVAGGAFDFDLAAVGFDDFLDDGETEAGAVGLGGEEGLKKFVALLGRHADAGILEVQKDGG